MAKQGKAVDGKLIALFCNVDVSPSRKLEFAKAAIRKGYRIEPFDLERLRSLLDSSLKEIRRRYLSIDDEVATRLRSAVRKLLRFPAAQPDSSPAQTAIEGVLADQIPRRLFDLLMQFEEEDVLEVPGIGPALHKHLKGYYQFRQEALRIENDLLLRIGKIGNREFPAAWQIYLRYVLLRFGGAPKDKIVSWGNFLNYSITWDDAERVFQQLYNDGALSLEVSGLFAMDRQLNQELRAIITTSDLG